MKNNKNRVWRFLYKLHRYIGLVSAIILIMLSITGIALNHTESLKLDSQMIKSNIILDWYGIQAPSELTSFNTKNSWLTQAKQSIYFNNTLLLKTEEQLIGAVETDIFIVVALNNSLQLLSLDGELIEQISVNSINKIGLTQQQEIVLKTNSETLISNDELVSWHPSNPVRVHWSIHSPPPKAISHNISHSFRASILPTERVILDLHSGRLFGLAGVIIVDISGVFLVLLALSGCAIWLKHKFRAKRR